MRMAKLRGFSDSPRRATQAIVNCNWPKSLPSLIQHRGTQRSETFQRAKDSDDGVDDAGMPMRSARLSLRLLFRV